MGVNHKNSPESHRDIAPESQEIIFKAQLDKAYANFQLGLPYSKMVLASLNGIIYKLQNNTDGVKLPYARLLSELKVSNDVCSLIGSRAPLLAIDNSFKFTA